MMYLFSFIFGAAIGSFVNVIVARLHVAPIINGRSKCLSCNHTLSVFDLVPIISYLFLKGKCRYCKESYGREHMYVEIVYGVLFVFAYHAIVMPQVDLLTSFGWGAYYTLLFIVLGVMALYDRIHMYVPVSYLLSYCVLTGVMLFLRYTADPTYLVLVGPLIIALPFFCIWVLSSGRAIGFADVVLFLGVGAFFGVAEGFAVLLLSVWIGAVVGVYVYARMSQSERKNTAIPFVPFIIISFIIVLFTGIDIFSITTWVSGGII